MVQTFPWNITVAGFLPIEPDYQLVTLLLGKRQNILFQFGQAHYDAEWHGNLQNLSIPSSNKEAGSLQEPAF
jgi:hypothetical protein